MDVNEIEVKHDSVAKLAAVSGKPTNEYLFAPEFNAVVDKVKEIDQSISPDGITTLGTEVKSGNNYTYTSYAWKINGQSYANASAVVISIPSATTGFKRKDISVLNTSNDIVRIAGTETDGEVVTQPDTPIDTILLKVYDVDGDVVSVITPTDVSGFVKKSFAQSYVLPDITGTNASIPIPASGASQIILTNASLTSIACLDLSEIVGNPSAEVPYVNKLIEITNSTGNEVKLKHATGSGIQFFTKDGLSIVIPNKESLYVKYNSDGAVEAFRSWSEVDLSNKADLVGGKVPASQLPSYVDDVIEGYFNGTNFYIDAGFTNLITPESGKIYINIAVTPATQYRWSGTTYVEISPSLALGETSSTAYRGDRGKVAYDHSQVTGNPHNTTKADIGLGNVDNTSDLNKPISTATQTALNLKEKVSNKVTNFTSPSNTTYPTTQAVINENKKATITVELIDLFTVNFYAPNALRIKSTSLINGSGTITLKVNDVAYTLGNLIAQGAKITVETTTASVYNLIVIYE